MSFAMQEKWDARYRERKVGELPPAQVLAGFMHLLPRRGHALDVACGLGSNAIALARHGLEVVAMDISPVAMDKLGAFSRANGLRITARAVDLQSNSQQVGTGEYDVIVVSRFLDRRLCPVLVDALKPCGLLFYQTFTAETALDPKSRKNPAYLLHRGELLELFSSLHCVIYREDGLLGDLQKGLRDEAMFIGQKPASIPGKNLDTDNRLPAQNRDS